MNAFIEYITGYFRLGYELRIWKTYCLQPEMAQQYIISLSGGARYLRVEAKTLEEAAEQALKQMKECSECWCMDMGCPCGLYVKRLTEMVRSA